MTMTQKRSIFLVKRFLYWAWWGGVTIVVSQLLVALTLPSRSVSETLRDLSNLRLWELVGLPVMIGGGLLVTLLQTLVFEPLLQHRKNQKHHSDRR